MRQGIGTLSEKTVHAVMKNYYAPDTDMHEIPIENFVADIYTGQEIGYDHSFAFFDRDPIPSYAANSFTDFYRRLAGLRHANPALAAGEAGGEMVEIRNNAEDCLMTFVREVKGNRVVAVMNLSPYAIHADYYTGIYAGMYTDAMTGVACELRGHVEEDMAPWSYRILTR